MPRILIVDDDQAVRSAIELVLTAEGYDVTLAGSGELAIDAMGTTPFGAIVVDIFMPGMDGLESIREFRRLSPSTPIIAMSGYSHGSGSAPDFLSMATKLGACSALYKPFGPQQLLAAIAACLGAREGETAEALAG